MPESGNGSAVAERDGDGRHVFSVPDIGGAESEARRMLNPDHATKAATIDRDHPIRLVFQRPAQGSPAGGEDLPVQPGPCLHLAPRLFGHSLRAQRHAKYLQVLDDDGAGRVRKPAAGPVMPVAAHRRDPPPGPAQAGAGALAPASIRAAGAAVILPAT